MFEKLKEEIIKEEELRLNKQFEEIKTAEGLKNLLNYCNKKYKNKPEEKLKKYLISQKEKRLNEQLNHLKFIEESEDFKGEFIITLEWVKSKTWGYNPHALTNYGFKGSAVTGCGYCKTSTATAEALNSNLRILKLLCIKKEEILNKKEVLKNSDGSFMTTSDINRTFLGYGSGYSIIPKFEGGVGVSSHENILKNVGLYMRCLTDSEMTNVYLIRRMTEEELNRFKEKGY